jgi:hypothetical protein
VQSAVVDVIEGKTLREVVQEGEEPLITLLCGHSFALSSLDGTVGLSTLYSPGLLPVPRAAFGSVEYCRCPTCRGTLSCVRRYSRLWKWLEAEKLSSRFHASVRRQNETWFAEALRICAETSKKADRAGRKLSKEILQFRKANSDPLRVSFEAAGDTPSRLMKLDTTWEKVQEALVWALTWQQGEIRSGLAQLFTAVRGVPSEQVAIRYAALAIKRMEAWEETTACREFISAFETAFSPAQTHEGEEFLKSLTAMRIDEKLRNELLDVVTRDLGSSPGWGGNGHRMQCPNGHVYVIGECGGAMETSRCPDCGATIGGASHRLAEGNTAAVRRE